MRQQVTRATGGVNRASANKSGRRNTIYEAPSVNLVGNRRLPWTLGKQQMK